MYKHIKFIHFVCNRAITTTENGCCVATCANIGLTSWKYCQCKCVSAVQFANQTCFTTCIYPDSKVHGANTGPIWGRQDPGGLHVGPMNFVIWVPFLLLSYFSVVVCLTWLFHHTLAVSYISRESWVLCLLLLSLTVCANNRINYDPIVVVVFFAHHTTPLSSVCRPIWKCWNFWNACQVHFVSNVSKIR